MNKHQTKQLSGDFCLFCDMGLKRVDHTHTLKVNDHQKHTVEKFTVKCNKRK